MTEVLKLCECGCGQPAPIATSTSKRRGQIKGQPMRFVHNHHWRGRRHTATSRTKMRQVQQARMRDMIGAHVKHGAYVRIYVGHQHPMADRQGYTKAHRLVAAAALGRMLRTEESVHHVNLDASDNSPDNLIVISEPEHRRIHALIQRRGVTPTEAIRLVFAP